MKTCWNERSPRPVTGESENASAVRDIIRWATALLRAAGVDEPSLNARTVVASALQRPRLELDLLMDCQPDAAQLAAIEKSIRRLARHEPIQYVLGSAEFMGHRFKCDRRALIPRPETEELVELVLSCKRLWRLERPKIIDLGTGSGCIAISLALRRRNAEYWAVDISPEAIRLARENARFHKCLRSIRFIRGDLAHRALPGGLDAAIANPPYVCTSEYRRLPEHIRHHEPRIALDGGRDGLATIRPLVKNAFHALKPGRFLFLEIGFDQWAKVNKLLHKTGFVHSEVRADLAGRNRMVTAVK